MVQAKGVEPLILSADDSKSPMYASSNTSGYFGGYRPTPAVVAFKVIRVIPHRSDTVLKVRLTQKDLLWLILYEKLHS